MIDFIIKNPKEAKALVLSIIAFSQDAKFEATKDGVIIPLKCDVPDKMRIEFTSDLIVSSEHVGICIKELQRMYRAIDLICNEVSDSEPIVMQVTDSRDFLVYKHGSTQFKIGLATDRALIGCVDTDEFKMFDDIYSFTVPMERIKMLFRHNSIVRSSEARIFIIRGDGDEIAAKLEDEESLSSGMVAIKMSDKLDNGIFTPLILKADMFKALTKFPGDAITLHYTDKKAIIAVSEKREPSYFLRTRVLFAPKKAKRS